MRYAALLRGVNVGGKHRVPSGDFKAVLEGLGFRDVRIYLNSGNAVFTSERQPDSAIVQAALEAHFDFTIPTLVIPGSKLRAIAEAIPKEWTNDAPHPHKLGHKSDVIYLFPEVNTPDIIEKLGHRPDLETMKYVDGAVVTTITRTNQAKGSLQKLIGSDIYSQTTIRNVNTARKLAEMVYAL